MNKVFAFTLILLAVALAALGLMQRDGSGDGSSGRPLVVYCAAGLKTPILAAAEQFEKEFGAEFQFQYGGTGTLLSQIQIAKRGDVFIAADGQAADIAREKGAARERIPIARQYPVIAVTAGNPKNISSLDDLFRDDVRVAVSNPEAASIGKATKRALGDRWDELAAKVAVMKPTVTEIASDLTVNAIDAAVIWNSTVPQFQGLEAIRVPAFDAVSDIVSASVLAASDQPAHALRFMRYLAAPEKGGIVLEEKGFETVPGDRWEKQPDLILYSGGVNRPAIEKLLNVFKDREGISITTTFNGCGILCASMQAMTGTSDPKFPDAYYACDLCFVPPVAEQFPEAVLLTETDIGIVVRKDNPENVKTLLDLAMPDLRVGLCNAKQSTLGYMTAGMLRDAGLLESIRKNVDVEVPTADFLINQLRAGALDAAIVYRVNAQLQEEHLDFLPINHEGAKAIQPFSVRVDTPRRQLATRLLDHLLAHPETFIDAGFVWRGEEEAIKSSDIKNPPWLETK